MYSRNFSSLALVFTFMAFGTGQPARADDKPRTPAAIEADTVFWDVFNGAKYDQIPLALEVMKGAYLRDPTDAVTAAHIAWTHAWKITEQERIDPSPGLTDNATLAKKYFERAVKFDRKDARYLNLYGAFIMAEGFIHQDPRSVKAGRRVMDEGVRIFPEFNLLSDGFISSRLPANSKYFQRGLQRQWENTDICIGAKIDRDNPDMTPYMSQRTDDGPKRVCWSSTNGPKRPHNFEGFFLNFGDMLVKNNQWQLAQKVYANAKLAHTYPTWKYKDILEQRIANAQQNVAEFNAPPDEFGRFKTPIMSQSAFGCVACHAN